MMRDGLAGEVAEADDLLPGGFAIGGLGLWLEEGADGDVEGSACGEPGLVAEEEASAADGEGADGGGCLDGGFESAELKGPDTR